MPPVTDIGGIFSSLPARKFVSESPMMYPNPGNVSLYLLIDGAF